MREGIRFVSPVERALYLKTMPALRDLPPTELAAIAARAKERSYRRGAKIYELGEPVLSAHIIAEGKVNVQGGEWGGEAEVDEGNAIGLLSMLARWEEGLAAHAATDVLTLELDVDDIYDILSDNFTVYMQQVRNLSRLMLLERSSTADGAVLTRELSADYRGTGELDLIGRLKFLIDGINYPRSNMDALVRIASAADEVHFEPGHKLWDAGEPSGFWYVLVSGQVACQVEKERTFHAGVGYPLGNIESLAGLPRWYTAVAEQPVIALRSQTELLFDLLEDHFGMAGDFLATLASGLIRIQMERGRPASRDITAVAALQKRS